MSRFRWLVGLSIGLMVLAFAGLGPLSGWPSRDDARATGPDDRAAKEALERFYGTPPSAEQVAMLADGVATEDELRTALAKAADCVEASGVQALRVGHLELQGKLVFGIFVPPGGDVGRAGVVSRICQGRHSAYVQSAYSAVHANEPQPKP